MNHRLFVYGTLKKGYNRHGYLAGCKSLGSCWTSGYMLIHRGSFPAMCPHPDSDSGVYGEVYEVDDETLRTLDDIEGVKSGFYSREKVETFIFGACWAYLQVNLAKQYKVDLIESGMWSGPQTRSKEFCLNKDAYKHPEGIKIEAAKDGSVATAVIPFTPRVVVPEVKEPSLYERLGWSAHELSTAQKESGEDLDHQDRGTVKNGTEGFPE